MSARFENIFDDLVNADAGMHDERGFAGNDFAKRSGGIGHTFDPGRIVRRPDDDQIIFRPGLWVDGVAVGDEIDDRVAGVRGDQIDAAVFEDGGDPIDRASSGEINLDSRLLCELGCQSLPEPCFIHSTNDRNTHQWPRGRQRQQGGHRCRDRQRSGVVRSSGGLDLLLCAHENDAAHRYSHDGGDDSGCE